MESDISIDTLEGIAEYMTKRLVYRVRESGLPLSTVDEQNLYSAARNMVYFYEDKGRLFEDAFAFQHPANINDLLLDLYNRRYRGFDRKGDPKEFRINPPAVFRECFRENFIELFHTNFFHDFKELGFMAPEDIKRFYEGIGMDGSKISSNVEMMSLPSDAEDRVIEDYLDVLEQHPVPLYAKIGDIMHNSQSRGSIRQLGKMTIYERLVRKHVKPLYRHLISNLYRHNKDRISTLPRYSAHKARLLGRQAISNHTSLSRRSKTASYDIPENKIYTG